MGFFIVSIYNKKKTHSMSGFIMYVAATYFSTFYRSIIGGAGLNFSVRNGKR